MVEESEPRLVWLLARNLGTYSRRDGCCWGDGRFSFGVLESAGYAFNRGGGAHGHDLVTVLQTQATRDCSPRSGTHCGPPGRGAPVPARFAGQAEADRRRAGLVGGRDRPHMAWDASGGVAVVVAVESAGGHATRTEYLTGQPSNAVGHQAGPSA